MKEEKEEKLCTERIILMVLLGYNYGTTCCVFWLLPFLLLLSTVLSWGLDLTSNKDLAVTNHLKLEF